jgi:hypothetical protein
MGMNAEIFRDEPIGHAAFGENTHERQIRHVLHGSEDKGWTLFWQKIAHGWFQEMV